MDKNAILAMPADDYMGPAQITFFQGELNRMLADARGRVEDHKSVLATLEAPADPADFATVEETRAEISRFIERDTQLIRQVMQALDAIEAEEYGYCLASGAEIGLPRLLSQPTALFSFEEQSRQEQLARHQAR